MVKIFLVLMGLLICLCACGAGNIELKRAQFQSTIPTCSSDKECEIKWSAARSWVLNNSYWKIQHITNDFIETYNPTSYSPGIAVRVVKEPMGQSGYRLIVNVWCNNPLGCHPNAWDAAIDFNRYVNSAR
jgi:hypothetical protein